MQRASGTPALSSHRSPDSDDGHHRTESYSTRRLAAAIDTLRREGETVLWELNSLMTQNSSLEQHLLVHTEELDMMKRSLANLSEQHRTTEQQYKERVQALRSELRAVQEERQTAQSNDNYAKPDQGQYQSPPPHSSRSYGNPGNYRQLPQPTHALTQSRNPRGHPLDPPLTTASRGTPREGRREPNSTSSRSRGERHRRSHTPPSQGRPRTQTGHEAAEDFSSPAGTPHEPPISPIATLIGSDGPARPRSKNART